MVRQPASDLLLNNLDLLLSLDRSLPVLDLACGEGRNGLVLAEHGMLVVFADRSENALKAVEKDLIDRGLPGRTWQVDLELARANPLSGQRYSAVIGFRYLHRPLFPAIKNAVMPGGLVVYRTFTVDNRRFGRPDNPDFLLQPGELKAIFEDWETIDYFEGRLKDPDREVAQVVARKLEAHSEEAWPTAT